MKRFWDKVDRREVDDCWPWKRFTHKGYGKFQHNGKSQRAHRVSWQLIHGDIPKGMCVCHRCDNPTCCNPVHLYLGTMADNTKDRDSKGRGKPFGHASKTVDGMYRDFSGAGLTRKQGIEISSRYLELISSLSKEYGVTESQISALCTKSKPYLIKALKA